MSDGNDGADFDGGGFDNDASLGGATTEAAVDFGDSDNAAAGGGLTEMAAEIGGLGEHGSFDHGVAMGSAGFGSSGHGGPGGHGGHGGLCDFNVGFAAAALACMGVTNGTEDFGRGRRVKLPGLAWNDRVVQVLAWPHGDCNVARVVKTVAEKYGLFNLSRRKPDLVDSESVERELIDTTPFDGRKHNTQMPSGWYPGATGFTRTFKQYWQLGSRRRWWSDYKLDLTEPVHVMVQAAQWFFNETGDFETRVAFVIKSKSEIKNGQWVHREDLIAKHRKVAQVLADAVFTALKDAPPSATSVVQRRIISKHADVAVAAPAPVKTKGKGPATKLPPVAPPTGSGGGDPIAFDMSGS